MGREKLVKKDPFGEKRIKKGPLRAKHNLARPLGVKEANKEQ